MVSFLIILNHSYLLTINIPKQRLDQPVLLWIMVFLYKFRIASSYESPLEKTPTSALYKIHITNSCATPYYVDANYFSPTTSRTTYLVFGEEDLWKTSPFRCKIFVSFLTLLVGAKTTPAFTMKLKNVSPT